jgi:hypothetical protein
MDFIALITHPTLSLFAELFRVTIDPDWRQAHPAEFYPAWDRLAGTGQTIAAQGSMYSNHDSESDPLTIDLLTIITGMVGADMRLALYTDDELHWLLDAAREHRTLLLSVLFVKVYTGGELKTPVELADATGTSEAYWRNHAAAGDIPGVIKKGKQWLIPTRIGQAWHDWMLQA